MLACSSPWRFAAYRVLLRLLAPRHPPYALFILTFSRENFFSCFTCEIVPSFFYVQFSKIAFQLVKPENLIMMRLKVSFDTINNYGGDEETRTPDPLRAKQVLSQLSYTPMIMVGLDGFEPSTSRLSGVRSNQLSYRPIKIDA
jgi:hypothetical protein